MVDVSKARRNVQQEEVKYRSSVSESTFTKMGASLNFINDNQYDSHGFYLNGGYTKAAGVDGLDGNFICMFDMEIIGISFFNTVAGSSGTTEIDLSWLDGSESVQGSIFSTLPAIDSTAGNNAYGAINIIDATNSTGTGITLPVLSKTEFNQFDAIRFDITQAMSGAENCGINIHFRPR